MATGRKRRGPAEDSPQDPAAVFRTWAAAALGTASVCAARADPYGAQLATARAEVYQQAARLLGDHDTAEAVRQMLHRAGVSRTLTPPLLAFDPAGLSYIRARAWTYCARHIDPTAEEVQPPWPER